MDNYVDQLLALEPQVLDAPKTSITYGEFVKYISIKEPALFEETLKRLAQALPFKTSSWPCFGSYVEDWYMVELGEFKCNLFYCERGGYFLRKKCDNLIDLAFEVLRIVAPKYTESASTIAAKVDRIADQRLLIWLRMSSEIFHMYQVNPYFGLRVTAYNVGWMCEELVRMGVSANVAEAFENGKLILKGLMTSGMPNEEAERIIHQLREA